MNTEHLLVQSWDNFVSKINTFMDDLGIPKNGFACDHAAIRVNSILQADTLKNYFEHHGRIISENMINGRPILIIELDKPLLFNQSVVPYVELPYPSAKVYPTEGWEHIELIIPGSATSIEQLIEYTIEKMPEIKHYFDTERDDVKVKFSSPKG